MFSDYSTLGIARLKIMQILFFVIALVGAIAAAAYLSRAIVNPGSVGQPRDRDPRTAYAIFDPERNTWEYRRLFYDIAAVQARMQAVGLPERHIIRLEAGW